METSGVRENMRGRMLRPPPELLPPIISLALVFLIGILMGCLLSGSDRVSFPVVGLKVQDGVDISYAGQYVDYPEFWSLVHRVRVGRLQALRTVEKKIGLTAAKPENFVIRFKDWADFGASSQPARAEAGDVMLVTLSARQSVLGVMDVQASLVHEFVHGVMRESMGEDYLALPRWVREGIAVWASGQLQERSRDIIARAFLEQREPAWVARQLALAPSSTDDYFRDALVFEYVSAMFGDAAVRRLVTDLATDGDVQESFEKASGYPWAEFRTRAAAFIRDYAKRLVEDSGLAEFQEAKHLEEQGDLDGAVARLESLLDCRPGSILQPHAWYWIGRHRYRQGKFPEAAEAFSTVLSHYPEDLGLQGDTQLWLSRTHLRLGEYANALFELKHFFREQVRSPRDLFADAEFLTGRAYFGLGDYPMAAQYLQAACRTSGRFPRDAYYYLSLAYLRSGETFSSRLALAELALRFPGSKRIPELRRELAAQAQRQASRPGKA